jgi:hypothetical protein
MLIKDLIQKGNIQNLTNLILNPFREKRNHFFSNLNNCDLYSTKKNKMFLMQEMVHGIKDGRIKMAKHMANAMECNPT